MGAIVLVVGIIGVGAVIAAIVVFTAMRRRRNVANSPVNPGAGAYPPQASYPPQQPMYPPGQPPYPSTPQQGYATPSEQPPENTNPYTRQPPHQGH
ncbi:hypothetical protein SAMN05428938_1438 [Streptomyces sp. KS_5]|nr:hypothetical protein SAMN05428938_1438 [Streptomyces sp. KS_5]